eukprot:480251_1
MGCGTSVDKAELEDPEFAPVPRGEEQKQAKHSSERSSVSKKSKRSKSKSRVSSTAASAGESNRSPVVHELSHSARDHQKATGEGTERTKPGGDLPENAVDDLVEEAMNVVGDEMDDDSDVESLSLEEPPKMLETGKSHTISQKTEEEPAAPVSKFDTKFDNEKFRNPQKSSPTASSEPMKASLPKEPR